MKENFIVKESYTKDEVLNYCNNRENYILSNIDFISKRVLDELFLIEKLRTKYSQKYFNGFEIYIYSAIKLTKKVVNMYNIDFSLRDEDYETKFKKIIKYFVVRFNINSDDGFLDIENIESSFFNIKYNNYEFNVRRMFPRKKNEFKDMKFFHKFASVDKDYESINNTINRIVDYYAKYETSNSFYDAYFIFSLDRYNNLYKNEYTINYSKDFKLLINKLPINIYDQNNITLYFKNKNEECFIDNIFFYHKFAYKLYGKKEKDICYHSSICDFDNFDSFLILANVDKGVAIYETGKGLKIFEGYIIDNERDIQLDKNIIYLKNKSDFLEIDLEKTFFTKDYTKYYIDSQLIIEEKKKIKTEKLDKKQLIFYISDDISRKGNVLRKLLSQVKKVELIDNIFKDDSSINYKIYVDTNNIEQIVLLDYLKYDLASFKIYNISVDDIYHFVTKDEEFYNKILEKYKKSIKNHENSTNNYLFKLNGVCNKIFEEICKEKAMTKNEAINYINETYIQKNKISFKQVNDYLLSISKNDKYIELMNSKSVGLEPEYYKKYAVEVDKEEQRKWKSEYKMFSIIKRRYNDAIYQYRSNWLNKQSLDVFIPSLNIAFEYQGIQHYKEIDYFKNEEDNLEKRKKLDELKRSLCENHNVKLIEWQYNDPLSEIVLNDKLGLYYESIYDEVDLKQILNKKDNSTRISIDIYNHNIETIKNIKKEMEILEENNHQFLSGHTLLMYKTSLDSINSTLKLENSIDIYSDHNINNLELFIKHSIKEVENFQKDFNDFKNNIENDKKVYFMNNNIIDEKKSNKTTDTFEIDDSSVFDALDNYFASMPLNVLEKTRKQNIANGEDTEIIDKAIDERKRRDEAIKQQKIKEEHEAKQEKKANRKSLFWGLLFGLFSNNKSSKKETMQYNELMTWEQDEIEKGNYSPWNFEEEELEEDDYYYEDDEE